jgi:HlyD family secretion protein
MTRFAPVAVGACLLALVACGARDPTDVAVGTIERDRVELVAEAQEPIVAILVREGDPVAAGDVVLELDGGAVAADLIRAEGAHDQAVARLAELARGPRPERMDEARAALAGTRSILARDEREWRRVEQLFADGVASRADLDLARARRDDALARRDQAAASLAAMVAGTTVEELDQARAAVVERRGALEAAQLRLDRLRVRAPTDGVVDAIPFKRGDRPPAGAVVAVLLTDAAPYARVYVPEPARVHVRAGGRATVRVDGIAEPFAGRVRLVSGEATFTPFFALTERDRGRLVYVAEVDLTEPRARELPTGIPAEARFAAPGAEAGDG